MSLIIVFKIIHNRVEIISLTILDITFLPPSRQFIFNDCQPLTLLLKIFPYCLIDTDILDFINVFKKLKYQKFNIHMFLDIMTIVNHYFVHAR